MGINCSECGVEVPRSASLCPDCWTPVPSTTRWPSSQGRTLAATGAVLTVASVFTTWLETEGADVTGWDAGADGKIAMLIGAFLLVTVLLGASRRTGAWIRVALATSLTSMLWWWIQLRDISDVEAADPGIGLWLWLVGAITGTMGAVVWRASHR